jgi:L-alanine-DL-glutamate epimerase-like enolase superfamily enzyme
VADLSGAPTTAAPLAGPGAVGDLPRVEHVEARAYTVPLGATHADGTIEWDAVSVVAVLVRAGDETGLGWSYTDPGAACVVRSTLAPAIAGLRADDLPAAHARLERSVRNLGRGGVAGAALSAVDVALWDLRARLLGVPLVALLGRARQSVPVYGSGGFTTDDEATLARDVERWVGELGARAVKLKIAEGAGTRTDRDLARVRVARHAAGDDVALFVDANGGYSRALARRVADAFADQRVVWFEEPVPSDDTTGLAALRAELTCDVAAGEYCWRPRDAAALLAAGAVDCLQLDVTRVGGFTGWLAAAAIADAAGCDVSAHCAPQLSAHVACAAPRVRHVEWFVDHASTDARLFDGLLAPVAGELRPSASTPGHGVVLRGADAEHLRVA